MKAKFVLRRDKVNSKGYMPVMLWITGNGIVFKKSVQEVKVLENHWDNRKERVLPSKKSEEYNNHVEFNKKLDTVDSEIKELFRYNRLNDKALTKDDIILKLESSNQNFVIKHNFFKSFEEFIEKNKTIKVERTIKGYVTTKNFFKSFNDDVYPIDFAKINVRFFDDFQEYAFNTRETKNNYFAKLVTIFKTFMSWAEERGHHNNQIYNRFKASEEDVEVIYLTYEELMKLNNYQFKSEKLGKVRDVYCFACFTGLRYSDVKSLKPSNIQGDNLVVNLQKTKSIDHLIPLNKYAKEIIEKYEDSCQYPLPIISHQKFNEYLKDCCEEVEINQEVTTTRYIGKRRIDRTVPKYKLITSHTARKTFVTNSLILGMSETVVKKITGHKKDDSFRKYVDVADQVKSSEMNRIWN